MMSRRTKEPVNGAEQDSMNENGRVALVTGAANGIGRAITERFLADGLKVVAADVDTAGLEQLRQEVHGGDSLATIQTDISDRAAVTAAVQLALERFGRLDVLAANAGIADGEPILELG